VAQLVEQPVNCTERLNDPKYHCHMPLLSVSFFDPLLEMKSNKKGTGISKMPGPSGLLLEPHTLFVVRIQVLSLLRVTSLGLWLQASVCI